MQVLSGFPTNQDPSKTITLFISLDHFKISVDIKLFMFLIGAFVGNRFKKCLPVRFGGGSPIIEALGGFIRSEFPTGILRCRANQSSFMRMFLNMATPGTKV